jgi:thioredoxin-like negative regulator of GroEL
MDPILLRLLAVAAGVAVVAALGWWWQQRNNRVVTVSADAASDGPQLQADHLAAIGLDLRGAQSAAILLGSPTCSPCDTVKDMLRDLETERSGFRWAYADAADHLDLAQEHRVMRVPTLFVIEPSGRILARTSGVPRPEQLRDVLDGGAADPTLAA